MPRSMNNRSMSRNGSTTLSTKSLVQLRVAHRLGQHARDDAGQARRRRAAAAASRQGPPCPPPSCRCPAARPGGRCRRWRPVSGRSCSASAGRSSSCRRPPPRPRPRWSCPRPPACRAFSASRRGSPGRPSRFAAVHGRGPAPPSAPARSPASFLGRAHARAGSACIAAKARFSARSRRCAGQHDQREHRAREGRGRGRRQRGAHRRRERRLGRVVQRRAGAAADLVGHHAGVARRTRTPRRRRTPGATGPRAPSRHRSRSTGGFRGWPRRACRRPADRVVHGRARRPPSSGGSGAHDRLGGGRHRRAHAEPEQHQRRPRRASSRCRSRLARAANSAAGDQRQAGGDDELGAEPVGQLRRTAGRRRSAPAAIGSIRTPAWSGE